MSRMPAILAEGRHQRFAQVVGYALLQALALALAAYATRQLFAALHVAQEAVTGQDTAFAPGTPTALGLLLIAGALQACARVLGRRSAEALGQDYTAALRATLYRHLARLPHSELAQRRAGALALRFVGDLSAVRNWVAQGLTQLVSACIVLPLAACTLAWLHPALALAATVPVLAGLLGLWLLGHRLAPAHQLLRRQRARLAADMSERAQAAAALHALGRTDKELRRLHARTDALRSAALHKASLAGLLRGIPDLCLATASAALLGLAIAQQIAPATVAAALAVLGLLVQPLRELASVQDRQRAWQAARSRCEALLAHPVLPRRRSAPHAKAQQPAATAPGKIPSGEAAPAARLQLQQVRIGPLQGIDLELYPGERVALSGANGAGKSLLLRCIAGLDLVEAGQIRINGHSPLQPAAAIRKGWLLLAPDSPLLAGSLRQALTLGCARRPDDAQILATAQAFGLQPCIARLGGLDGRVAESGRNLSGGERARLLLARAALLRPRLLLIDALDTQLDGQAGALLAELFARTGATALVATHRPDVAAMLQRCVHLCARQDTPCTSTTLP